MWRQTKERHERAWLGLLLKSVIHSDGMSITVRAAKKPVRRQVMENSADSSSGSSDADNSAEIALRRWTPHPRVSARKPNSQDQSISTMVTQR
jgi:hypothetical protein